MEQYTDAFIIKPLAEDDGSNSYQGGKTSCAVEATLEAIGGKWKVLILHELFNGTKRFGEVHRNLRGITQKMLTQQLREMERDGLVHREVYMQVPPKVEYSLTALGKTLQPVLEAMHLWGKRYLEQYKSQTL
ncbi:MULTISPECIES: winged helix-turn-helix transcriptional regulator [Pseudanabaena]|uniref:Transcriptional regulator, HxlR family n=2 Tax=Pseudanabaena TaxID=1152 RepID=L8MYB1_9CYAN|nr:MULTISPECIES: winged helix-turn-helix transcriptional regulator [Pseudanabaena]ELS31769.1 transcriptional regulator, HxlR family [Pseudanabaena biceps PCC 7429]MDG3495965.1 winged helix-turn-helix transcriptional regulator [Pseudanabaena catenata USMAC16]